LNVLISIHSRFEMWRMPLGHVDRLRRDFPAHTFLHSATTEEAVAMIPDADVAFSSQINRGHLAAARRLRWIHSPAAGIGGMLYPEMLAADVVLTNSRGLSADTIAEHVLAVTLAMFRRLPEAFRRQAGRDWAQNDIGRLGNRRIAGARVVIVGLGAIGGEVARRMAALGAQVTGFRRRASGQVDGVSALVPIERLREHLPRADVVVIAAPHTHETRNLIGRDELASMSRDSILVNVSRGQLVDEAALFDALRAGAIAGAALDVFVDEPLPAESPFWDLPNVLITPHTSGVRGDYWDAATELFAENLRRFEAGETLLNVVDKQAGY
jgi:phosphoglycerate dehydrogenase-like enzyme